MASPRPANLRTAAAQSTRAGVNRAQRFPGHHHAASLSSQRGMDAGQAPADDGLLEARVLVELGELDQAELQVAAVLDDRPDDLTALNLFAKIKHIRGELTQAIACWAQIHSRSPHNETAHLQL